MSGSQALRMVCESRRRRRSSRVLRCEDPSCRVVTPEVRIRCRWCLRNCCKTCATRHARGKV